MKEKRDEANVVLMPDVPQWVIDEWNNQVESHERPISNQVMYELAWELFQAGNNTMDYDILNNFSLRPSLFTEEFFQDLAAFGRAKDLYPC